MQKVGQLAHLVVVHQTRPDLLQALAADRRVQLEAADYSRSSHQCVGGAAGQYGMTNVGEFVSEAFTNPKFQQALRGMKAPAQSPLHSAWDYLVRTIKSILGLPHDSTDALSAALEIGVSVMRENMALRKRGANVRSGSAYAGSEMQGY